MKATPLNPTPEQVNPKEMRAAWIFPWLLLGILFIESMTRATTVTIQLSGTWTIVNDTGSVLDGSIKVGSNFVATLVYDNTVTNGNTGSQAAFTGFYAATPPRFDFRITSGNYSFTLPSTELVEIDVDHLFGSFPDEVILYAEGYLLNGPLPGGVSGGFGYVNPGLQNYDRNVLANSSLIGVPWSLSFWPSTDFYLYMEINGAGPGKYIEFDGTIDRIVPNPMPKFAGIGVNATQVNFSGSNVVAGNYVLVASTNLIATPAQWTVVMTNKLAGEAGFNLTATNEFSGNVARKFYRYRSP